MVSSTQGNGTTTTAMAVRDVAAVATRKPAMERSGIAALATMDEDEFKANLEGLVKMRARMDTIHRSLMKEGHDYGTIPGTGDKKTLLKSGADKLCQFHGLVAEFKNAITYGDGKTTPHIQVETTCFLHSGSVDGPVVGQGAGAASSWEKKYRYVASARKCPACGKEAIIKGQEQYGGGWLCFKKKDGCGAKWKDGAAEIESQPAGKQDNPDPYDALNTLVKMSAKRAHVDATIRTTATGETWTQDMEDVEEPAPPPPPPKASPAPAARQVKPQASAAPIQEAAGEVVNPATGEVTSTVDADMDDLRKEGSAGASAWAAALHESRPDYWNANYAKGAPHRARMLEVMNELATGGA